MMSIFGMLTDEVVVFAMATAIGVFVIPVSYLAYGKTKSMPWGEIENKIEKRFNSKVIKGTALLQVVIMAVWFAVLTIFGN